MRYVHFRPKWLCFVCVALGSFFLSVEYMNNCTATTRRGQQCKLQARPGSTTCFRHTMSLPQCPVCLMDMTVSTARTLECGHTFHTRCIERWKRTSRTCPMCRVPFDQPVYKIRVSVQRVSDQHVTSETYTTSNIGGLVSTFNLDPFIDPRFITDILFDIAQNESVADVLRELDLRIPTGPFVPVQEQHDQHHI
jgi:hypothetical protein